MQESDGRAGPIQRRRTTDRSLLARAGAAGLLALVFWIDVLTPPGVAIPALYVMPVLVCVWAKNPREPLVIAAVATVLAVIDSGLGGFRTGIPAGFVNRALSLLVVWTAAGVLSAYRQAKDRWTAEAERAARVMGDSLKSLDEIRYAINQAAIVATTNQRGVITTVNDKFCEISGYSRQELLGQDHRIVNSGHHREEFFRQLWRTISGGQVWRGEIRNRAKDGSTYWVDTTIVPFLDWQGKPRQYLAIHSDITQRKVAESMLRQQAALTQLGSLAAVVAHEVRNPLAGLRASLQVLEGRFERGARERDVIATMVNRIDGLNEKVEDLLLYARPKSPRLQPVDVREVAKEAIASAQAAVGSTCPQVELSEGTVVAHADRDMLRAVVLNLTLNACQVMESGQVQIDVAVENGTCMIAVRDRGPGIPSSIREQVFEPFFTTRAGGTGLGLAIVKRLMEAQGGAVALKDREGGGTVAEISVPLGPRESPVSAG
jgi:PAS domain S-box-containing protein